MLLLLAITVFNCTGRDYNLVIENIDESRAMLYIREAEAHSKTYRCTSGIKIHIVNSNGEIRESI